MASEHELMNSTALRPLPSFLTMGQAFKRFPAICPLPIVLDYVSARHSNDSLQYVCPLPILRS
jgi:hypothetical protein